MLRYCHERPRMMSRCISATAIILMLLLPVTAMAQVTFEWKTARHDTLYQTVEECLGMLYRVEGQTIEFDTTNYEILPMRLRVASNTVPDVVVATAQKCSQKFTVDRILAHDSLDITRTMNAITLFIKAKRDSDALALTERWIAKLPASQDTLRNLIRYQVALLALKDQPTRFTVIRRLADSIDFKKFWESKMRIYGEMMWRATAIRDTSEYESIVVWFTTIAGMVSDSMMQTEAWVGVPWVKRGIVEYMRSAKQYSQRAVVLAKLRESVTSYLEFMAVLEKDLGVIHSADDDVPKLAKPILAEYWFPEKPATARPTRGKVAVVYPIQGNICNPCYYAENVWGRLAKKFPEIEFTGLARTWGQHGQYFGILPPDQEARLIDSFHRKVYGFPGMIAVHNTRFFRIDDTYDRRVINEHGPNEDQYPLFAPISPPRIIDWEGRFLPGATLAMDADESMELLFEALLLHRPK